MLEDETTRPIGPDYGAQFDRTNKFAKPIYKAVGLARVYDKMRDNSVQRHTEHAAQRQARKPLASNQLPADAVAASEERVKAAVTAMQGASTEVLIQNANFLLAQGHHDFKFGYGMTAPRVTVLYGRISCTHAHGQGSVALEGAEVSVQDNSQRRIGATRLALEGPFALAFPKTGGTAYVTIDASDGQLMFPVKIKGPKDFERYVMPSVAKLNTLIRQARPAAEEATPTVSESSPDVLKLIEKLGELRDSGVLTEAEFVSKKAELLDRL